MTYLFNLESALILTFILFGIGAYGVIVKRNMVIVLMSIEIMLNAVNLSLIAFNYFVHWLPVDGTVGEPTGQYMVLLVIAVAAAEAAVGLAILVNIFRTKKTIDNQAMEEMKG